MNTHQLQECMRQDAYMRDTCVGCFALDQLPTPTKLPFGLIANTEPSQKAGEHWVAVWIDGRGRGEYFDSYGLRAKQELQQQMKKWAPNGWRQVINGDPIQEPLSTVCGQHCLWFLYQRARGREYMAPASDRDVQDFVERKFALDMPVYDVPMLVMQICKEFVKNKI